MLELYTWTTPNGIKPLILLEELGLPYQTHWVHIGKGAQHTPEFRAVNPNAKIPALRDGEQTIFESGAILVHLAERAGRFLPSTGAARSDAFAWLFFQVGGVGPMFGQLNHFMGTDEKHHYAINRYRSEVMRLYGVLDERLAHVPYLAGEYGIADMATVGWASLFAKYGISADRFPHVQAWLSRVGARPAVQRARAMKPDV